MAHSLDRLLNPRTIAVVGGREAERVIEQCDRLGFAGEIWPVNPSREEIRGRRCYRSVTDLPDAPDAAYVAVNRERSIDVVAALASRGCGGAICYAAGFAEAESEAGGARDLQTRLVEAAGGMPIVGPNCYGLINAVAGVALWPDQHGAVRCDRGIAIVTQSSNIAINLTMQRRGLPIAIVMTAGNQAQTGLSELGLGLLENEDITVLGLHIEGLDDVKAFERLAFRARELGKPIVVLKVGKSEKARTAALTHTASLSGSDAAHDALFRRLGIARVRSLDALIEALKLLHCGGPLTGSDILSLSCSGGEAALMADAAVGTALTYRAFPQPQRDALKAELGGFVGISNPLDYNTFIWGDWPAMTRMFAVALTPGFDLAMLVLDFPRADRCDGADWHGALDSFIKAAGTTGARAAVVATIAENLPEDVAERLMKAGIAPLCGIDAALAAAEAAAAVGRAWSRPAPEPLLDCYSRNGWTSKLQTAQAGGSPESVAKDPCRGEPDKSGRIVLDEYQSKLELKASGLVIPEGQIVHETGLAVGFFRRLGRRPVAMKALGVAHKSDVGAVVLNVSTEQEVLDTYHFKLFKFGEQCLIEEMAPKPLAELIVGVTRDPVVGLVMTIGAGGVLAELLGDTATLLLPVSEADVRTALSGLKIGQLLEGYRQSDAADIDALVANILCIARYAVTNADTLEELDVNPLFATQFGSVAVDALIVKRKSHE